MSIPKKKPVMLRDNIEPIIQVLDGCANPRCMNRVREGTFVLMSMAQLSLVLCAPCAEVLKKFLKDY